MPLEYASRLVIERSLRAADSEDGGPYTAEYGRRPSKMERKTTNEQAERCSSLRIVSISLLPSPLAVLVAQDGDDAVVVAVRDRRRAVRALQGADLRAVETEGPGSRRGRAVTQSCT